MGDQSNMIWHNKQKKIRCLTQSDLTKRNGGSKQYDPSKKGLNETT